MQIEKYTMQTKNYRIQMKTLIYKKMYKIQMKVIQIETF